MKHFIQLRINMVYYYYNSKSNKIGDFSAYNYYNNTYIEWDKYRKYRGRYEYSNLPHYESNNRIKAWCYNRVWYDSYEEYLLAVMV